MTEAIYAKRCEIRISDGETFGIDGDDGRLYLPKTVIDQVVGLLDEQGKINIGLMPSFMFGGQKYFDSINNTNGTIPIHNLFDDLCVEASTLDIADINNLAGHYFQAESDIVISLSPFPYTDGANPAIAKYTGMDSGTLTFNVAPDDGVSPGATLKLEANDYLVFKYFYDDTDGGTAWFGVINNTYGNSSTTEKGVVKLATSDQIIAGVDTTSAVTPAGAKLAVQTFGYKHPTYNASVGALGSLKAITSITTENGHVTDITTADIPDASFNSKGVVQLVTDAQAKVPDLTVYAEHYAVSPAIAKNMIDYWGKVDYCATLEEANGKPYKTIKGKMVLVGV